VLINLTISIVSHGHAALLHRILSQLDNQETLRGCRVVVTLNLASEAFDPSQYTRIELVVVRNDTPKGFGANHNAAFAHCNTKWFGILNPDLALADKEPFTDLIENAASVPKVGLVAPQILSDRLQPEDSVRRNLTPWSLISRHVFSDRKPLAVAKPASQGNDFYWLAGMCLLVTEEAYRSINGFDERFFLYCEDYDLCARLYNKGYAIHFDPRARVIHEAQRDSRRSFKHLRWHLTSLVKVWCSSAFLRVTLA